MAARKFIIDTDVGVDDSVAVMLALSAKIDIVAITTVSGNTSEDNVYRNVKEVLRVCQKSIPIYRGAKRPLINETFYVPQYHGIDGLRNYWDTHTDQYFPEETHEKAANAIVRLALEDPSIGIICLGPLTNLAIAYTLEENLKFSSVEIMGGTIDAIGNMTYLSEFNIFTDPEAAHIVFERSLNLVMTPWETTIIPELTITPDLYQKLIGGGLKSKFFEDVYKEREFVCDALAMAAAIDPSIITVVEEFPVVVELSGKYSRGFTAVLRDEISKQNNMKKVRIIRNLNSTRFAQMLVDAIRD